MLKNKARTTANGKLVNGFTRKEAPEMLPLGPFVGGNPKTDPDEGTVDFGIVAPGPPDWKGEGAGANNESVPTTVGGAISAGNCCGPVSYLATSIDNLEIVKTKKVKNRNMFKLNHVYWIVKFCIIIRYGIWTGSDNSKLTVWCS